VNETFRLLKAYHDNDMNYLAYRYSEVADLLKLRKEIIKSHGCEEPIPVYKLNFEEVYRFHYGAAFCDKAVILTIGRIKDSITLELYLFEKKYGETECKTIRHEIRPLDKQVWDVLMEGIHFSDFWGLQEDNGQEGYDGSTLSITGFERPIKAFKGRYKIVHRWAAENTAIGKLFKRLLDLSGNKVDCFHFY
jgi:hypothetical protein